MGSGILIKLAAVDEISEYSMAYFKNLKLWKVVLETFEQYGRVYQIEDIYGGGDQGQECIICFC